MNSRHQIRRYRLGLEEVGRNLRGDERIYAGFRPLGYHAGNSITLAVYPHLLARAMARNGRPVRFDYVITLNDMEPAEYDLRTLHPQASSIAFLSRMEEVVAPLQDDLRHLTSEFPEIGIRFVPTTTMVDTEIFHRTTQILTQGKKDYLSRFLHEKYTAERNVQDMEFMGQVCGTCTRPAKLFPGDADAGLCQACGSSLQATGRHYWMYYIPLIAMKLRILQPDIAFLGSDYVEPLSGLMAGMKHGNSLEAILDFYDLLPGGRPLEFLLPPILLGRDGQKMSKSIGNISAVAYDEILSLCDRSQDHEISL